VIYLLNELHKPSFLLGEKKLSSGRHQMAKVIEQTLPLSEAVGGIKKNGTLARYQ
jgi:hypothetical protein